MISLQQLNTDLLDLHDVLALGTLHVTLGESPVDDGDELVLALLTRVLDGHLFSSQFLIKN